MRVLILTSSGGTAHDAAAYSIKSWLNRWDVNGSVLVEHLLEESSFVMRSSVNLYNWIQKHWPWLHQIYWRLVEFEDLLKPGTVIFGRNYLIRLLRKFSPELIQNTVIRAHYGSKDRIDEQIKDEIKKIRDRSIILIGFSGGFRRNEIVSLDYDDLDFVTEGLKIKLKRSKTDQFGEGTLKGLPYFDNSQYCPVISLKKWLKISKISSGPVFRRFVKGLKLSKNRLTDQTVALLIKKYLNMAGLDSKDYSGHSLRSGFATTAAESGVEERNIMAMTGHKSTEMVRRYIKEANLFKNNALNKIKI